ncbi:hypothetical protein MPSEU_000156200 [Mayamaea pseudoterrestris]|nr:hypothetical protein MPSEU_000156200 [Mayamaea pseudoterrestris]
MLPSGRQRGLHPSPSRSNSFDREPPHQPAARAPSPTSSPSFRQPARTFRLRLLIACFSLIVFLTLYRSMWQADQAISRVNIPTHQLILENRKGRKYETKVRMDKTSDSTSKVTENKHSKNQQKAAEIRNSTSGLNKIQEPAIRIVPRTKKLAPLATNNTRQQQPLQQEKGDEQTDSHVKQSTSNERLNVVLLYADDWTYRTLGMVNKVVHTPHLNAMAKRGMLFRRNCVTSSICWQSRATMFTGTTTSVHRSLKIMDDYIFTNDTQVPWEETLYPAMKRAGYHRGYIGKYHNAMPTAKHTPLSDWTNLYFSHHWEHRKGKLRHVTDLNGEDALHYLRHERPANQSFFLTVAFYATHAQEAMPFERQYEHQNYTKHLYEHTTIPTPKTATAQAWRNMPYFFKETNEGRKRWAKRYKTPEMFQHSMKTMYRMATEVDDVVGRIMDELKRQNVYNDTMVIFTTDNGVFHGEHGLADKWYPHEESIRVPLIIQDPRMPEHMHGQVNDDFTLSVDLAPTILAAAGVKAPSFMQGRDIAQLYLENATEASKAWRQDFFYEWNQGSPHNASGHDDPRYIPAVFALVQKDAKYFYWPQVQYEQIFDLTNDPFEENDIWNVAMQTNRPMLEAMRARYSQLKAASQSGLPV